MFFFIFSRAIQGIGFAGVMGTIWILIASLWEPKERGKWLGITSAGFTTSGVIGPIIGGVINDILNWRWIFHLNIPISIFAIIFLIKFLISLSVIFSMTSNKNPFIKSSFASLRLRPLVIK